MKKLINKTEDIVREMCSGIALAHPEIGMNPVYNFLYKKKRDADHVCLISGGGSGHEPAHGGLIGRGMLDVAVCGDVFASPSQIQIYKAIKETAGNKGTLLIVKNYSGDVMNFSNAAYLAEMDGIQVEMVKVNDDIAVMDSLYTVGRRGVAGTVLVHKLAGAAAEKGLDLASVKAVAEKAARNVRSIGFAFTSCTVPAKGEPTFDLPGDEMEYGVGIHGEPGIRREKVAPADELTDRMICSLLKDLTLQRGDEIALLINGFGGTPLMELYLACYSAMRVLEAKGIKTYRIFVGNFMTSLDMAGASISVMKLDEELKTLLDAESTAPAFKVSGSTGEVAFQSLQPAGASDTTTSFSRETPREFAKIKDGRLSLQNVTYIVDTMSEVIIKNEVPFCELDSFAGDGDFGMSIAKGFRQLKREWKTLVIKSNDISSFLDACSEVMMEHCGGASGPIWGIAFKSAAKSASGKKTLGTADVAEMLQAAVTGIQKIGERSFGRGAVVGDKTLIDALAPCADAWSKLAQEGASISECFAGGAQAAVRGAKETEKIVARMGRAGTVGERSLGHPDAGAHALGVIFSDIAAAIQA